MGLFKKSEPKVAETEAEKNEINKKGLTDAIRKQAEELAVPYTDAGGNDLPRTDVEERIRKSLANQPKET